MGNTYRFAGIILLFAVLLPTPARCERILVIGAPNPPKSPASSQAEQAEQQFWYELGIVLDRQEVLLSTPSIENPENFTGLTADAKFTAAAVMCEEQQAGAAVWLEKAGQGIIGFGMIINGTEGRLGRIVTFDTPMSTPADIALIAKELLEHGRSFAERARAAEDGWIIVPGDDRKEAETSPPTPEGFPDDIGALRDTERPGDTPEVPLPQHLKFLGLDLHAALSQGIASFTGPSTWVGGEIEGLLQPLKRFSVRTGFAAAAGPRLSQNNERILGYRLQPHLGVGVPFLFGNVGIDLYLNLGATYTNFTVTSPGYRPEMSKWWTFSPSLGMRILAPATRSIAFSFKLAFCLETQGKRIMKSAETDEELLKTPILFLNLAVGIAWSYFRVVPPPPQSAAANTALP